MGVVVADERRVMTAGWRSRIEVLLGNHPRLLATSVHNRLRAEGFCGSYPTVVRAVRDIRGPRFRAAAAASVPICTGPGEELQFDFCNLDGVAAGWGWNHRLRCFGAILCWARKRLWWFTTSEDQKHTFEGLVRALECFAVCPLWRARTRPHRSPRLYPGNRRHRVRRRTARRLRPDPTRRLVALVLHLRWRTCARGGRRPGRGDAAELSRDLVLRPDRGAHRRPSTSSPAIC